MAPQALNTGRTARRRRQIHVLALLAAVLMLAVIGFSAYLRLAQTGIGCADWPTCQSLIAQQLQHGAAAPGLALARQGHRLAASAVLLLAIALVLLALAVRPRLWREGRLAAGLLALALALAVLGIAAGGSKLPAVVLGNLLGGFAMLALAWRLARAAGSDFDPAPALRWWARIGALLVLLQVVLGGLVSATWGASACGTWNECLHAIQHAPLDWSVVDPWSATAPESALPGAPRGAWLQVLHRVGALLLLPVLAWTSWLALRQRQTAPALALYVLLLAQVILGMALASQGFPLRAVLLHNGIAAVLLALLVRWA